MDRIRKQLDKLMGRDRDIPISQRNHKKEHFSDPKVSFIFILKI